MENRKSYIYSIICPISKRVRYIGKTVQIPYYRFKSHISVSRKDNLKCYVNRWIHKLLKNNLMPEFKILVTSTSDKIDNLEKMYISHYRQFSKLTNLTDGGGGTFGFKRPYNKILGLKRIGSKMSDATRQRMILSGNWDRARIRMLGNNNPGKLNKKPVIQYDKFMNKINEYDSIKDASEMTHCSDGSICRCCNGIYNTAGGFKWKYKHNC